MNLLGGTGRGTQAQTAPTVISALDVQRSVNGAPVPVVYGTARLTGNMIWYGDFVSTPISSGGKSGGKGIGGGASSKGQIGSYTYQASFALGLAVGPIQAIGQMWATSGTPDTPPAAGGTMTIETGAPGQTPWSYLASAHPDQALAYNGLAYIGVAAMPLGASPSMPNLSFEVAGLGPVAAPVKWSVPPGGSAWSFKLTMPSYGAAPFAAIAAVTKAPAAIGQKVSDTVFDTSPAFCFADLLTSTTYGAGLAPALIGDLTTYATWCQAAGLFVSVALTEQRACREILREWLDATLADVYWSQGQIKVGVYGDQATTGTAADGTAVTFAPNLAPVMTIDDSLMLTTSSDAGPLIVNRKDPAETVNRITVEYKDRDSSYNTVTVTVDDAAHIASYGLRPAPSVQGDFIAAGAVAQKVADMALARATGVLATYEWRMRSPGELLEPFDVVAINDAALGLVDYPVRVTAVEEEDDTVFHVTAEDIPGLISAMTDRPLAANAGFQAQWNADPGPVNPPVIFEPPSALVSSATGLEIWVAVSGANIESWGGCEVWVSSDGNSYARVGTIEGAARQGVLASPLAAIAPVPNPPTIDAANTFGVDLSESDGTLAAASQADALALNTLCYLDGELIAYRDATLVAANRYTLGWLVRGAYGTAIAGHVAGAPFVRLDGALLRYPFAADRIGATVSIKFASFNGFGGGQQSLDQAVAYSYTIRGSALAEDPADVTGLASTYIAGLSQLIWSAVTDPRAIDYEVRLGTSWDDGQVIGRTALTQTPILGDGTYWVAAHFKVPNGPDVYSVAPTKIIVSGTVLTSNVIATYQASADGWSGTKSNTAVIGTALTLAAAGDILASADVTAIPDIRYLGGVVASGSYAIPASARVTLSRIAACNVVIKLGAALGYDINTVDIRNVADITQIGDVLGVDLGNRVAVQPQIRLSQDGVTWGNWQNWTMGSYAAMAFDAQVLIATSDPTVAGVLTDFSFAVDVPDRVDTGTDVAVPATGLTVTFSAPFNGGPSGAAVPNLLVTIHGAQSGDQAVTSARSLSGFTVQITNGGVGVARTVDWQAQGY